MNKYKDIVIAIAIVCKTIPEYYFVDNGNKTEAWKAAEKDPNQGNW